MKVLEYDKVKTRLASLCARSETCSFEIRVKLLRTHLSEEERSRILDSLIENNFVNDERFARAFVHDKAQFTSAGPVKIRHELMKRHIPEQFVDSAMESVPDEIFVQKARKIVKSRIEELSAKETDPRKIHDKLYQYLICRGFTFSTIREALPSRSDSLDSYDF